MEGAQASEHACGAGRVSAPHLGAGDQGASTSAGQEVRVKENRRGTLQTEEAAHT